MSRGMVKPHSGQVKVRTEGEMLQTGLQMYEACHTVAIAAFDD
jgi:hypothetical protein